MGSGKTTVGRRLAARLGRRFVDADKALEERCGVSIPTIFELEGEAGFRQREAALLDELTRMPDIVLATGGGVVTVPANRAVLRERGTVVFLRAGAADLWQRLKRDRSRPLLRTPNPRERIGELVAQRDPMYREVAHLTVTSGRLTVDGLVADIIGRLRACQSGAPDRSPDLSTAAVASSPLKLTLELGERSYPIFVGEDLFSPQTEAGAALAALAKGRQVAIVTDVNVAPRYEPALRAALQPVAAALQTVVLPAGEAAKDWPELMRVFDALLASRFDRKCLLIALGGGCVGDLCGFAAGTYQRGVDFVQVPTTLLAQVDSSVGGKTAINHPAGKNMIGVFHQPRLVLADVGTLRSLPPREIAAGLAEMIKHGAIVDPEYLDALTQDMAALQACDPDALARHVFRSCEIKAEVVAEDEREGDRRAILNFGHTFGHAIEAGLGFGAWLHGEAVGTGMLMAADLSCRLGLLQPAEAGRLRSAIQAAGLPMQAPDWPVARWLDLMSVDKKAEQGTPKFVLLDGLGHAVVRRVPDEELAQTLHARAAPVVAA